MKLSDIKGERTLDVIAEIIDPAGAIAESKEGKALFQKQICPKGVTPAEFVVKRLRKNAPVLIKSHKKEIIAILSTIAGVSPEEYVAAMTLPSLINDIIELLTDDVFTELFISTQSENGET